MFRKKYITAMLIMSLVACGGGKSSSNAPVIGQTENPAEDEGGSGSGAETSLSVTDIRNSIMKSLTLEKLKNELLDPDELGDDDITEKNGILTFSISDEDVKFVFKSDTFKKADDKTLYGKNTLTKTRYYACMTTDPNDCESGGSPGEAKTNLGNEPNFTGTITYQDKGTLAFSGDTLDTPLKYSNFGYMKHDYTQNFSGSLSGLNNTSLISAIPFYYGDVDRGVKDFENGTNFTGKAVAFAVYSLDGYGDNNGVKQFNGKADLNIGASSTKTLELDLTGFGKITYVGDANPTFIQNKDVAGKYYVDDYKGTDNIDAGFDVVGYAGETTNHPEEAVGSFYYSDNSDDENKSISISGSFGVVKKP
jgi:hypothetical protein